MARPVRFPLPRDASAQLRRPRAQSMPRFTIITTSKGLVMITVTCEWDHDQNRHKVRFARRFRILTTRSREEKTRPGRHPKRNNEAVEKV